MIRVTIELFPIGRLQNSKILSQVYISNVSDTYGMYDVESDYEVELLGTDVPKTKIHRFTRSKGHLALVAKALTKLVLICGQRN